MNLLGLFFDNRNQSAQRLIYRFGVSKNFGDIRFQGDNIVTNCDSVHVFPTDPVTKIVLVQHFWVAILFLAHKFAFRGVSPTVR